MFIVSDFPNAKDHLIGYLLYERKLSATYKLKETPPEEKDFQYYLEYPRQDHFPADRLDAIILQAVQNLYPKSLVKNKQVIASTDEEQIRVMQRNRSEKSFILFTPGLSHLDLNRYAGRSFDCLRKKITIYSNSRKEKLDNIAFTGYYDITDRTILDELEAINFI